MRKSSSPITHFKAQFPDGNVTEESRAFFDKTENRYLGVNLDIGWALEVSNTKNRKKGENTRIVTKKCLGSVYCKSSECSSYNKDYRPRSSTKEIEKQHCVLCDSKMERRLCSVTVNFKFGDGKCIMIHKGNHRHSKYLAKHLTIDEMKLLDNRVEEDPHFTPSKAVVSVTSRTGEVDPPLYKSISKILTNKDRAKYELSNARKRMSSSSCTRFLGEFEVIEEEYEGFILSAEVVSHAFCIVFCSPEIGKLGLPFDSQPIVTDVTCKVVEDYYLCSSVMYTPHLNKHLVIFQAIMRGLEWTYFKKYFEELFRHFDVSKSSFLGIVMDLSAAQERGFLEAFQSHFANGNVEEGRKYLKGCLMRWMQSVQGMASNCDIVPAGSQEAFIGLADKLQATNVENEFQASILALSLQFPNCKKWLEWWLQPKNASMVFRFGTCQHEGLWNHPTRNASAAESCHAALYKVIVKDQPLAVSLRCLLQCAVIEKQLQFLA